MRFREKAEIMDKDAIMRAITRISYEVIERNKGAENLCLIGVRRRGVSIAELIADKIFEMDNIRPQIGVVDISHYRDDKKDDKLKSLDGTKIDFDINGRPMLLVDDVLFTGRTVRAAIDAIMDIGRPSRIQLTVLIDRGHRELPFQPDFVGKNVPTSRHEAIKVLVPEYDGDFKILIGDLIE